MKTIISRLCAGVIIVAVAINVIGQESDSFVKTDRYTYARLTPEPFQSELFSAPITIKFGSPVTTIGDALLEVLDGSGYQLSQEHVYQRALYDLELPNVLRSIGPLPIGEVLEVLAGKAWVVGVDELAKVVYFDLDREYENRKTEVLNRLEQAAAETHSADENVSRQMLGVVPFAVGEYSMLGPEGTKQFSQLYEKINQSNGPIEVVGYSQSRRDWATQRLALLRAGLIKNKLVQAGVPAERISISAQVKNHAQGELQHTANVYHVTESATGNASVLSPSVASSSSVRRCGEVRFLPGSLKTNVKNALGNCDLKMAHWNLEEPVPVPTAFNIFLEGVEPLLNFLRDSYGVNSRVNQLNSTVDFSSLATDFCGDVYVGLGSLKQNISVALEGCGYSMGRWDFGDPSYELDWRVNKAFQLRVEGVQPFLEFVRDNYALDFHINQVDWTVDFFPHSSD